MIVNSTLLPDEVGFDARQVELTAIRAQGPGGQNVNKVSSAIHLRFDIYASTLAYLATHARTAIVLLHLLL